MVTEQYVSFETAKLLKEKGFKGACVQIYYKDEPIVGSYNSEIADNCYDCPSQSLVMRWLREVHHILISVNIFLPHKPTWIYSCYNLNRGYIRNAGQYNTYEEACEDAIQYCLKYLI